MVGLGVGAFVGETVGTLSVATVGALDVKSVDGAAFITALVGFMVGKVDEASVGEITEG